MHPASTSAKYGGKEDDRINDHRLALEEKKRSREQAE
jgi:hypothetical protein